MQVSDMQTVSGGAAGQSRPVGPSGRLESLDVLRGFAVLGIFAINIWFFALPETFYLNPTALDPIRGPLEGAEWVVWYATHVLVAYKFVTLFSMLFGAGIVLMAERSERGRHTRRMLWLLVFGLIHAYLIWPGDILVTYALCGLIVGGMREWRASTLWITGLVLIAVGGLINTLFIEALRFAPPAQQADIIAQAWQPDAQALQAQIALRAEGSIFDQISENIITAVGMQTGGFLTSVGWRTAGVMAIGMALYKTGVLTGARSAAFYAILAVAGFALGLPVVMAGVDYSAARDWSMIDSLGMGFLFNYVGSLAVAAGWMGLVLLIVRLGWLGSARRALAAAGRMAFTNYIAQSVIATILMYGFDLFGALTLVELALLVAGVWAVQLIWSPLWLSRFSQGPLEWLWRRATYGPAPPSQMGRSTL